MKQITKEMLRIYKPYSNLDWLNYKLVKRDVTFHHIQKRVDNGKRTIDNGALLMPIAHEYLHLIEYRDIDTYIAINQIFKYVNQQMHEPTQEQRQILEYLLRTFESKHKYDKNSKGKILIQRKYLERGILWNTSLLK